MMLQAFFVILLVIQEMGYTARHGTEEKDGAPTNAARAEAYAAVYPPVASALEQGRQVRS